jgi:hypothetical protein
MAGELAQAVTAMAGELEVALVEVRVRVTEAIEVIEVAVAVVSRVTIIVLLLLPVAAASVRVLVDLTVINDMCARIVRKCARIPMA